MNKAPSPRHIVWISPGFAADESDSQCIPPLQLLARELADGDEVHLRIVSLHYPQRRTAYSWHGLRVYPCYCPPPQARRRIRATELRDQHQLQREAPNDQHHSMWQSDAALLGHLAAGWLRRPHWVTLMGQDARPSNRYLRLLPTQRMRTIALSPFHAITWEQSTGRAPQRLIPWGIAPPDLGDGPRIRDVDVLGVGNLIPLKDFALWIDLVAEMARAGRIRRAVLIGGGPEAGRLRKRIERWGMSEVIQLTGPLPRTEVLAWMQRSRVLLHPSTYESFGFVLVEALALGLAVVSRPVGIARAGERWWLGADRQSLAKALVVALAGEGFAEGQIPHPLAATKAAYLDLWRDQLIDKNHFF